MPRVFSKKAPASGHRILVVDDSEEVLVSTRALLEQDGHEVRITSSGSQAVELVRSWNPHLLVVDFFMPEMTGEEIVRQVRLFEREVQILLQTGYASEKPPLDMLHRLDIQGYHDKSEGPDKLLVWLDSALKAWRSIHAISKSRQGLRYILEVIPEMHKVQTLEELLQGILLQMEGLIGASNGFLAITPEVRGQEDGGEEGDLQVVAATGCFAEDKDAVWKLLSEQQSMLYQGQVSVQGRVTVIPLKVGVKPLGLLYFDRASDEEYDTELLNIFAVQAAMALENCRLFGLATEDGLTHLFVRSFFFKRFDTELLEAARHRYPISLAMCDLDHFKTVNDSRGHQAGDMVIRQVCHVLRTSARDFDFLGRYGGDELLMAMPHTDHQTALAMAEQLRRRVEELPFADLGDTLHPTLSIGIVTVLPPDSMAGLRRTDADQLADVVIKMADEALYRSKLQGRNQVNAARTCRLTELAPLAAVQT